MFFKQLFCFHINWIKGDYKFPFNEFLKRGIILGEGYWEVWHCDDCKKEKSFLTSNTPVEHIND